MWVLSRAKHFGLQVRLTVISDIRIVLILMMEKTAGDNKQHCVLREFKRENLSKSLFCC